MIMVNALGALNVRLVLVINPLAKTVAILALDAVVQNLPQPVPTLMIAWISKVNDFSVSAAIKLWVCTLWLCLEL
jgi:hypothetical protein